MKRFTVTMAAALALGAGMATIAAGATSSVAAAASRHTATATTTTTLGPPAQGPRNHKLFLYVDTVTGGGTPKPATDCAMTNLFEPGQVVVFRMDGIQVATGGTDLTSANVLNAFVVIPGQKNDPMFYGTHGKYSYWTASWAIPANYPLGIVNFSVWVTTKAVPATATSPAIPEQTGIFSQNGLAPPSQLTVVKA